MLDTHVFFHVHITLTFFAWYWVDIKPWRGLTWRTYAAECITAGRKGKYLLVPLPLVCCDSFARSSFVWKLRFVCLLDQDASLCWLCCRYDSFDTSCLWNHLENWRWWRKWQLIIRNSYCKSVYTLDISAEVSERSFVYYCYLGPTCPREVFWLSIYSVSPCYTVWLHSNNNLC